MSVSADASLLEAFFGEKVEDVLDVLDAVDVSVDVNVAVIGVDGADELWLAEAEASMALDGADVLFLGNDVSEDIAVVECQQVARLPRLQVNSFITLSTQVLTSQWSYCRGISFISMLSRESTQVCWVSFKAPMPHPRFCEWLPAALSK